MLNIFERDRSGQAVSVDEAEYGQIKAVIVRTKRLVQELNTKVWDSGDIRRKLSEIFGQTVDDGTEIYTPFYTDFGKNIRLGKNVFVNSGCTFMDRGGITIGDNVFIAPGVYLLTTNHGLAPSMRRSVVNQPITIGDNVWIGARAVILPGVSVGENAVVGAGAVVTKNVPDNTVVAGNPASVVKTL